MEMLFFVLLAMQLIHCTPASNKRWIPDTNFETASNWDQGKKPCGMDRVTIPESSPIVFVKTHTTLQSLTLPLNGRLILSDFSSLAFPDDWLSIDPSSCDHHHALDLTFNATEPLDWFDQSNWCETDTEGGECNSAKAGLLDTERVPCATDNVQFVRDKSFFVDLGSGFSIILNALSVYGLSYATDTFATFLQSTLGRSYFSRSGGSPPSVAIRGQGCTENSGCACGNDRGQHLERICRFRQPNCPRTNCANAFKPMGHCCNICGGILEAVYGSGFNLNHFRDKIKRDYITGKDDADEVAYVVSKRGDGKIQVVFMDDIGQKGITFAQDVKKAIDDDIAIGGIRYAIASVILKISDKVVTPKPTISGEVTQPTAKPHTGANEDSGSTAVGRVLGIVIGVMVVVILFLVIAVYVYRRQTRFNETLVERDSKFPRMSSLKLPSVRMPSVRMPSVRMPTLRLPSFMRRTAAPSYVDASVSYRDPDNMGESTLTGFDNPMFGTAQDISPAAMAIPPVELSPTSFQQMQQQHSFDMSKGFDNPLYGAAVQESQFLDPGVGASSILTLNPMYDSHLVEEDSGV